MNKRTIQAGVVGLALVLSVLACSLSFSSAEVQNLRMARDQEGAQTVSQFNHDDKIYLVGDLVDANGANLEAQWIAVEAEGIDKNKVIWKHEAELNSGKVSIPLPTEAGPINAGKYQVKVFLNGAEERTLDYEVLKGPPTPTPTQFAMPGDPNMPLDPSLAGTEMPGGSGAALTNVHTSRDEGDTQPTSAFAQADTIFTHFVLEAPAGQAQLRSAISAVSVEGANPGLVFAEFDGSAASGPNFVRFSNSLPWPLGVYRVDLFVDGTPVQSLQVEVVGTNTGGASIQNPYASLDKDGNQASTVFPATADVVYVQFTLAGAPSPVDVKGVLVAREVQGMDANTGVSDAGGSLTDGPYVFSFPNEGPWPAGRYTVVIYISGQLAQQVDIQVQ
jgi:hypothetical protein